MLIVFIVAALCIGVDQLTKYLVVGNIPFEGKVEVIPGILNFTYIKNEGAAFGSFSDNRWVFLVFSTVLIVALVAYTVWKRPKNVLQCVSVGMLIGGGIGNMIDRIALGYVVDFIDFCAFPKLWMWVFNGADSFVCVGVALLMIWLLLFDNKKKPVPEKEAEDSAADDGEKGGNENDKAE